MKDYVAAHFPEKMTYDQLRDAVKEAWTPFPPEELLELVRGSP